jgi:hypothetical protein
VKVATAAGLIPLEVMLNALFGFMHIVICDHKTVNGWI